MFACVCVRLFGELRDLLGLPDRAPSLQVLDGTCTSRRGELMSGSGA